MDSKTEKKIQEIQIIEQNLHNLLLQKQNFQIELSENQNALEEMKSSGEEVYKIIGQIMLKTDKKKLDEELINQQKILELRIKTLEKQEQELNNKIDSLRKDIFQDSKNNS
jgi:prefoldin beta subunit